MLETAVRRRYPVNAEKAAETVNAHLDDPDPRVALRAAAIAAIMEGQNQKDEHKALDEFNNRVLELADRFGIDVTSARIGEASDRGTGSSNANAADADEE